MLLVGMVYTRETFRLWVRTAYDCIYIGISLDDMGYEQHTQRIERAS